MRILGIETSCDETSAAIVEDGTKIISHVLTSSIEIQQQYGGVVPEVASRKQAEYIIPILTETFKQAKLERGDVDAIAVTIGPGLIGSLFVGVETAKVLSYLWNKPLVPVNHLVGHIYSGWLDENATTKPEFPLLALVASGGHTDIVLMKGHADLELLGSTRDDAIGEAFDKVARMLELPYPGGPKLEELAKEGNSSAVNFPRPLMKTPEVEFSYSGLKTAVLYELKKRTSLSKQDKADIAASFQQAALETLVYKTVRTARESDVKSLLVTGGVAANQKLRKMFETSAKEELPGVTLHIPPLTLATDNATYIAAMGFFCFDKLKLDPQTHFDQLAHLEPNPSLIVTDLFPPQS